MDNSNRLYTGKEFNNAYPDKEFLKLTTDNEFHNGVQFVTGLNIDPVPFAPLKECDAGIYFTELKYILYWLCYRSGISKVRRVTIPANANVCVGYGKFKADRIILDDYVYIKDFLVSDKITEVMCIQALQTENIYRFLPENKKTENIRLIAVTRWPCVATLRDASESMKTAEICMAAVKKDYHAIDYVPDHLKTELIYLEVVAQKPQTIRDIPIEMQTNKFYLKAIELNIDVLHYVPAHILNKEQYTADVKADGMALVNVPVWAKDKSICLEAVNQNYRAIRYVPENLLDKTMCLYAVSQNGLILEEIPMKFRTADVCIRAIRQTNLAQMCIPTYLSLLINTMYRVPRIIYCS